jgi:hypothetical protein
LSPIQIKAKVLI